MLRFGALADASIVPEAYFHLLLNTTREVPIAFFSAGPEWIRTGAQQIYGGISSPLYQADQPFF
jgi:hypothetical protein